MKNNLILKFLLILSLIVSPLILTGCKTTQPKQAKIEQSVRVAAQLTGTIILIESPKLRPGFSNAVESLKILENGTNNITIVEVLSIVQRLDIKELKSKEAVIYISSGILLITTYDIPTAVPLEQSNSIRGIARAIRLGLETALQVTEMSSTVSLRPLPPLPPQ